MKKVVHFGKYYLPDQGGIENVTQTLAGGALRAGYSVTVVCFGKNPQSQVEIVEGVRVIRCANGITILSQPLSFQYFARCIREGWGADILHIHAPNMLGAISALLIFRRVPILVHWHSDVIGKGLLGKLLRPLEMVFLYRANKIVATSPVYVDGSKSLKPFRAKIDVVPIGIKEPPKKHSSLCLPRALIERINERKIILAIGRLVPYKGFNILIKSASGLVEDVAIVIVGTGPSEFELTDSINSLNLGDRVILAGRLSDLQLNALFYMATLLCLPSINKAEAFGVVILEAMSRGIPVVSTNIEGSGVPWVNQHHVSGINVPVGDGAALISACNRILTSELEHKAYSHGARLRFEAEFTEESFIKRCLTIYSRLLK